jgi:myo-inositol 2-dehydrogenase/D-chiro-inositol 1-dehydrogenase
MEQSGLVRVGVVGVGGMGAFHARTLAGFAGVEVVAVADPNADNANAVARDVGCIALMDPMQLATSSDVDGIVIASPDATHPDLSIAAIECGTRVLCEKPLATTLEDAQRVVDAERSIGTRLIQLGFMREYDPAHVQVREALSATGPIDYIRTAHRNVYTSPRSVEQIIGQSMVHDIHTVRFLSGSEFTRVMAHGGGSRDGSFRHIVVVGELSSGAHVVLEFDSGGFAYEVSVEVLGRNGDVLTAAPARATMRSAGVVSANIGADWFSWFAAAYAIQDRAWVDSIVAGEAVGPTAEDGLMAQRVVAASLASLATGQFVDVIQQ